MVSICPFVSYIVCSNYTGELYSTYAAPTFSEAHSSQWFRRKLHNGINHCKLKTDTHSNGLANNSMQYASDANLTGCTVPQLQWLRMEPPSVQPAPTVILLRQVKPSTDGLPVATQYRWNPNTVGISCQYRWNPILGFRNRPIPLKSYIRTVGISYESPETTQHGWNPMSVPL